MTEAENKPEFSLINDTPYLWGVFCEDFVENGPCFNGYTLYMYIDNTKCAKLL